MSLFPSRKSKIFAAVLVLSGGFLFSFGAPKPAQALYSTSTYQKLYSEVLTAEEWNNLFRDFANTWLPVSMNGPLGIATPAPTAGLSVNGPIIATGNVGIGATNPTAKLEIIPTTGSYALLGGSYRIGNVALPISDADAATKSYVDSALAGTSLPTGTSGQTLYHNGSAWLANSLLFNNGTNIGIGTTSPGAKLEIVPTAGSYSLLAGNQKIGNVAIPTVDADAATKGYVDSFVNSSIATATGSIVTLWGGATGGNIWSLNSGNVGIGTTAPTQGKLVISGTNSSPWLYLYSTSGNAEIDSNVGWFFKQNGTKQVYIGNGYVGMGGANDANPGGTLTALATGNVGIAKTAPVATLDTVGGANFTGTVNGIGLCIAGDCKTSWTTAVATSSGWTANGSSVYKTDTTGNVGIGITNPSQKLDVNGSIRGYYSGASVSLNLTTQLDSGWSPSNIFLRRTNTAGTGNVPAGTTLSQIISKAYDTDGTDTDVGIIRVAQGTPTASSVPGEMVFSTNDGTSNSATERMRILSSGNVGIGTAAPGSLLHVFGSGSTNVIVESTDNSASRNSLLILKSVSDYRGRGVLMTYPSSTGDWYAGTPYTGNGYTIGYHATQPEYLANSKIFISSSGNLGVAKTNLAATLDVVGGANFTGTVNGTGLCIAGDCKTSWTTAVATSSGWTANGAEVYKTSTSGNVGIGLTNPTTALDVNGVITTRGTILPPSTNTIDIGSSTLRFANGYFTRLAAGRALTSSWGLAVNNGINMNSGSYLDWEGGNARIRETAYALEFNTYTGSGLTTKLFITGGGNIGIAKTNPAATLDTVGSINASGTVNGTGLCIAGDCKTSWITAVATSSGWTANGTAVYKTDTTGNVGIGTTNPLQKLSVAGIIESTTGGIKFPDASIQTSAYTTQLTDISAGLTSGCPMAYNFSSSAAASGWTCVIDMNTLFNGTNSGNGQFATQLRWGYTYGYASTTFAIEDSDDNSTWTTISASNNTGFQALSGTTKRYVRFRSTDSSGWGNIAAVQVMGGPRNTTWASYRNAFVLQETWRTAAGHVLIGPGNVGIAKSVPAATLDVVGGANFTGTVNGTGLCIAGDCKTDWASVGGGGLWSGTTTGAIWSANSGNVGIGTTAPGAYLHIKTPSGAVNAGLILKLEDSYLGGTIFTINNLGNFLFGPAVNFSGQANPIPVNFGNNASYTSDTFFLINPSSSNSGNLFQIKKGTTAALTVDTNGNLGIAKSVPVTTLDTVGGANFTGTVNGTGLCIAGDCKTSWITAVATSSGWTANGAEVYKTSTSGNVGIGTLAPTNPLSVLWGAANTAGDSLTTATAQVTGPNWVMDSNSSNATFLVSTNNAAAVNVGGSIGFAGRYSGTSQATFATIKGASEDGSYSGYLAFGTRKIGRVNSQIVESMRIDAAGNVGIGKTNPTQLLEVSGNIKKSNKTWGSKSVQVTSSWTTVLSLTLSADTSATVDINYGGANWSSHSAAPNYKAQYIVRNGSGSYGDPGSIISEFNDMGTANDYFQSQIVNAGSGVFNIQIKANDGGDGFAGGTNPPTLPLEYSVDGNYTAVN